MLFAVDDLLTQQGIVHWIDFGTLLGAMRHQTFIPWDYDADISFVVEHPTQFDQLTQIIGAAGYDVVRNPKLPDELKVQYSSVNHNNLDLYGYHRSDDGILRLDWGPNSEKWFFPARYLAMLEPVTLYGRRFLVPSPLDDFLIHYRYGPGYQTPMRPFYQLLNLFPFADFDMLEITPSVMSLFAQLQQLDTTVKEQHAQMPRMKIHHTDYLALHRLPQPQRATAHLRRFGRPEERVDWLVQQIYKLPPKPRATLHRLLWGYLTRTGFLAQIAQTYSLNQAEITPAASILLNQIARRKARLQYLEAVRRGDVSV